MRSSTTPRLAAPAATGADAGLRVALGGHKNDPGTTIARVLTLQAASPRTPGVAPVTVSGALVADPATGRQPLTGFTFSPLGHADQLDRHAGGRAEAQLNLSVRLKNNIFPGNNTLYHPVVQLTVRYPGYAGNFLTYPVPVSVWDATEPGREARRRPRASARRC